MVTVPGEEMFPVVRVMLPSVLQSGFGMQSWLQLARVSVTAIARVILSKPRLCVVVSCQDQRCLQLAGHTRFTPNLALQLG